ncbi:MAG TPA: helix-turn-helix transcriptional regulator [Pyrinomonadaceae bacterium]|nr:helix-turn-helix transcriptional regulator [Pyrinomonadaceae bacterium]
MSDKLYRDDLIRAAMAAKGYKNKTLAQVANLNPSTISSIKNGNPNVTLPTLKSATDALGLNWWTQVFNPDAGVTEQDYSATSTT